MIIIKMAVDDPSTPQVSPQAAYSYGGKIVSTWGMVSMSICDARLVFQAMRGSLKESHYPAIGTISSRPGDVLVFIVGGATYEEAAKISELNATSAAATPPGPRVVLGGSVIHNSTSFLQELGATFRPTAYVADLEGIVRIGMDS
jgi:hypothetical protein